MNRLFILLTVLLTGISCFSQNEIPTDYFRSPLDIPLHLSGTFGELRNNHFHSGLDIRTQQREGLPVYASADGYVSRIKVEPYGYGKALYIQHPNGYSTVYAHLREYAGPVQEFVISRQYAKESYELEVFPEASVLPVRKGDIIAYSGNTGGSGGPHLHFEIRDNASRPMNPQLFGVEVEDTRKPLINNVFVYPTGENSHVNQSNYPVPLRLIPQKDGSFLAEKIKACGTLGFGVSAYDQQDAAPNKNGVYKIETSINGEMRAEIIFDRFSFAETRYINRYLDYSRLQQEKNRVQKLFVERNNPLSLFKEVNNNGYVEIQDGFDSMFTIEVSDVKGNTSIIRIPIEGADLPLIRKKEDPVTPYFIYAAEGATIEEGKFNIHIPPKVLYDDTYLDIRAEGHVLHLHRDIEPLHSYITISVDAANYREADIDKVFIGKLNYKGDPFHSNTTRKGTVLSTRVRSFGSYGLGIDTVPPAIKPVNFAHGKWVSSNKNLQVAITDNLSGIKSYRATINDKWVLMEYEYKNNVLTYTFEDGPPLETENNFKLIVTDNVGNSSKFEATFYRK